MTLDSTIPILLGHSGDTPPQPWCYLFVRHNKARAFTERLDRDRMVLFVHEPVVYRRRRHWARHTLRDLSRWWKRAPQGHRSQSA